MSPLNRGANALAARQWFTLKKSRMRIPLKRTVPMHSTSALAEPAIGIAQVGRREATRLARAVEWVLLLVAGVFFALHFVHLKADFPNYSPWMDWSKYTDEGWYGDAAIRHYQLGHWNVPGDFNPAAALPVWPALEMVLFRVTGVSLAAARAFTVVVFGLILVCSALLLRRWSSAWRGGVVAGPSATAGQLQSWSLAPAVAVLLLAVSPFCYAFSRLAILEPMLVLLTLVALLAASVAGAAGAEACGREPLSWIAMRRPENLRCIAWTIALGLLLSLMVLTKTTGVFLFPAIFWMLWGSSGYRLRPFLPVALVACATGAVGWGAYYELLVRPHYLLDYRYLFSANAYTGVTRATFWPVLQVAVTDSVWIGAALSLLALAAVLVSLPGLCFRRFRRNPLAGALLLWVLGYGAFLAYHDNPQPRYYVALAVPLTLLVAMVFDGLLGSAQGAWNGDRETWRWARWPLGLAAGLFAAGLLFAAFSGARRTISFVRHPEYTWIGAAGQIAGVIDRQVSAHPGQSRLLLSISGSDISLITGLPSICDDFGTMTLPDRVAAYKPGWFASWNNVEDDKMDALTPAYRLVRVAAFPAFDDPDRNLLILYRLDAVGPPGPKGRPGRRRSMSVPPRLRTRVGEQPSPAQLKH
jgi:4-amino-4-deoxy-L-arabinose transferase-like glycosyltransferase